MELLLAHSSVGGWAERVQRVARPVFRVAVNATVLEALEQLRRQESPVVVGARAQVVGLVTAGDLVDEIVGELGAEQATE